MESQKLDLVRRVNIPTKEQVEKIIRDEYLRMYGDPIDKHSLAIRQSINGANILLQYLTMKVPSVQIGVDTSSEKVYHLSRNKEKQKKYSLNYYHKNKEKILKGLKEKYEKQKNEKSGK